MKRTPLVAKSRRPTGNSRPGAPERSSRTVGRSEEHTSELQSPCNLVCRLLLEKKKHPGIPDTHQLLGQRVLRPGAVDSTGDRVVLLLRADANNPFQRFHVLVFLRRDDQTSTL